MKGMGLAWVLDAMCKREGGGTLFRRGRGSCWVVQRLGGVAASFRYQWFSEADRQRGFVSW